jgi:hypothetical protein
VSDTPRTDANIAAWLDDESMCCAEINGPVHEWAMQLERELAEAKAELHAANKLAADRLADLKSQEEQHTRTFAALLYARQELETANKDGLSWQLHAEAQERDALKEIVENGNLRRELVNLKDILNAYIAGESSLKLNVTQLVSELVRKDEALKAVTHELKCCSQQLTAHGFGPPHEDSSVPRALRLASAALAQGGNAEFKPFEPSVPSPEFVKFHDSVMRMAQGGKEGA